LKTTSKGGGHGAPECPSRSDDGCDAMGQGVCKKGAHRGKTSQQSLLQGDVDVIKFNYINKVINWHGTCFFNISTDQAT
jgi:hypothetical protein